jgi:hypothetical protein
METEDEHAHTFTSLGWQALKLVKKLRNQRSEKARAEARAVREGGRTQGHAVELPKGKPFTPGISNRREALKFK